MHTIIPIVEGDGEVAAIPLLLRRLLTERSRDDIAVATAFRVKRQRVIREGELERSIAVACRTRLQEGDHGLVLVLLDSDKDCPFEIAPALLERARSATRHGCAVVMPCREAEAWPLADIEHIAEQLDLPLTANPPNDPESVNPKAWLERHLGTATPYKPTSHQAALFAHLRPSVVAASSPSFAKLIRDLDRALDHSPFRA